MADRKRTIVEQGRGITITAVEVTPEELATLTVPAGFSLGMKVTPGVVSPEFQEKLDLLGHEVPVRQHKNLTLMEAALFCAIGVGLGMMIMVYFLA